MGKKYNFLNFSVDTQTHQLSQAGNRLDISSTAYKLLSYFIENPGTTISRQNLTDHVWSNKIVAETSLDKLIQRLRKILGDTGQHKEIINTIHGEGFVFLPEVSIDKAKVASTTPKKTNAKKYKFMAFVLLPILLLMYYANTDIDSTDNLPIISQAQAKPMVVALLPDLTNISNLNHRWMTQGGMHYLNEKFKNALGLKIKRISLKNLADSDPERFAINLTNNKQVNSSIIVSVNEQNQEFYADVKIRGVDGVIASKSFQAATIKSIYDAINVWSLGVLKITVPAVADSYDKTMSDNRFAVENYIRGMAAQVSGDAQQAIKYFELAIDEDKRFWLAWYQLTISYRKQGQYEKAMSIVKVFENTHLDDDFMIMVINSKVNIHNALGEFSEGLTSIDAAIALAKKNNNSNSQAILLTSKAYAASQLSKFPLALESIEESIKLTMQVDDKDHDGLGRSYSTLSGIQRNMNKIDLAKASANKAINYMQKAGNKRYVAKLKLRLSSIVAKQGQWQNAENLVADALLTLSELNAALETTSAYMRLIDFQLLTGKFVLAEKNYALLTDLMANISSKDQLNYYLITKADLMLNTKQLTQAKDAIEKLKKVTISDYHLMNYYLLAMRYYQQTDNRDNRDNWTPIVKEFINTKQFEGNPLTKLAQAQLAIKQQQHDLAIDAFEQAKSQALEMNSIRVASSVFNPYIKYLLEQNKNEQAQLNLLELEKFNVPVYPYQKLKAQLLFSLGENFKATALLQELKAKAGKLWNTDDQLLLERYKSLI